MQNAPHPEPWLRGRFEDLPAIHLAVLHALELTTENIDHWCMGLTTDDFHSQPFGLPSLSFHLRHISRSLDRLLTYAEGNQLTASQLSALKGESSPDGSVKSILDEFHASLENARARIRGFASTSLELPRSVGRRQLPTTVGGLLVHIADHTQRHTGQIVTTAKLLAALRK